MLKSTRAELHERFARWLEQDLQQRAARVDEIIGYHLERHTELRKELDPEAEELDALADEAGERLVAAGKGQYDRSDMPDSASIFSNGRAFCFLRGDIAVSTC